MQKSEMWLDYKVDSGSCQRFIFDVDNNQKDFKVSFDLSIDNSGLDIEFLFCTYEDSKKLFKWMNNKTKYKYDSQGQAVKDEDGYPITVPVPRPQIKEFFNVRSNILDKTINLTSGSYTLLFDNTYSAIRGKNLWLHIVETWDEENPKEDLPIMQHLLDEMPSDVATCVTDANDCYMAGHYNQCSVMLRKTIDTAIRIKFLQSELTQDHLFDSAGNEIGLSLKIKLLKKKKLVTQKRSSDIEQIKWFGDIGAHGTMRIAEQDIKDNIEPKTRSFLAGLNLKA